MKWQKCPVCDGTGLVSRPPGIAGDRLFASGTSMGPWKCTVCNGMKIILEAPDPKIKKNK